LALSTRVGQLTGGALVGAVAASMGGGVVGYQQAFVIIGLVSAAFIALALALKKQPEELATVRRNEQAEAGLPAA
jgi:predicted lipid-binding transport protein (Tim44 family)